MDEQIQHEKIELDVRSKWLTTILEKFGPLNTYYGHNGLYTTPSKSYNITLLRVSPQLQQVYLLIRYIKAYNDLKEFIIPHHVLPPLMGFLNDKLTPSADLFDSSDKWYVYIDPHDIKTHLDGQWDWISMNEVIPPNIRGWWNIDTFDYKTKSDFFGKFSHVKVISDIRSVIEYIT